MLGSPRQFTTLTSVKAHLPIPAFATTCLLLMAALGALPAQANPLDTFGFGARAGALASAATANPQGPEGAYYNPAALSTSQEVTLSAGVLFAEDFLTINDRDARIASHLAYQVGFAATLPLGDLLGERFAIALALHLPHDSLYDVKLPDDTTATYPFWDGHNRRLAIFAALAAKITPIIAVGVGLSLLPDVEGRVNVDLSSEAGRNDANVRVDYNFAPTAGIHITPTDAFAIGLTYRGPQHTTIAIPVDVQVTTAIAAIQAEIVAPAYAVPHQLVLGTAYTWAQVQAAIDLTWSAYQSFRYPSPDVTVFDQDGTPLRTAEAAPLTFTNTLALRLGLEWQALDTLALRLGYAYIQSPVTAQRGYTNLLDADRNHLTLGVGLSAPASWRWSGLHEAHLDLQGQLTLFNQRAFEKSLFIPGNPGFPTISMAGGTYALGTQLRLVF